MPRMNTSSSRGATASAAAAPYPARAGPSIERPAPAAPLASSSASDPDAPLAPEEQANDENTLAGKVTAGPCREHCLRINEVARPPISLGRQKPRMINPKPRWYQMIRPDRYHDAYCDLTEDYKGEDMVIHGIALQQRILCDEPVPESIKRLTLVITSDFGINVDWDLYARYFSFEKLTFLFLNPTRVRSCPNGSITRAGKDGFDKLDTSRLALNLFMALQNRWAARYEIVDMDTASRDRLVDKMRDLNSKYGRNYSLSSVTFVSRDEYLARDEWTGVLETSEVEAWRSGM